MGIAVHILAQIQINGSLLSGRTMAKSSGQP